MNNTRVYLYQEAIFNESEMRGQELTKYLLLPDSWTDNLDDTLDTAEIVLEGLPFREEFAPTTKFIIDKGTWQYDENGVATSFAINQTFHWVVESDIVTQPILSDNAFFRHTISLIEPAVIMQHRLCDNIAITYELKDVTLEHPPTVDVTNKAVVSVVDDVRDNLIPQAYGTTIEYLNGKTNENGNVERNQYYTSGHRFEWIMPTWYTYLTAAGVTDTPSWDAWRDMPANQPITDTKRIVLPLPMLQCSFGSKTGFVKNGYCSYNVVVQRKRYDVSSAQWENVQSFTVNPTDQYLSEAWTSDYYEPIPSGGQGKVTGKGWVVGGLHSYRTGGGYVAAVDLRASKIAEFDATVGARTIDFIAQANYIYRIELKRKTFNPSTVSGSGLSFGDVLSAPNAVSQVSNYYIYEWWYPSGRTLRLLEPIDIPLLANLGITTTFNFPYEETTTDIVLSSAPPASAYYLFNKAQMATYPHEYMGDNLGVNVDQMSEEKPEGTNPSVFFVSPEVESKLRNTTIVENFYYQKNFWEMAMEVGRYIHARPKASFALLDRFRVDWKEYGKTDIQPESGNKISVYNSRFIEEYLAQVSSYVDNLIQIGGTITEYLVAKSADDTYTVSNDNAILQTSYPIIEIVDMQCKNIKQSGAQWCSLVGKNTFNDGSAGSGFVFGKAVYDILPITLLNEQGQENNVNKGVALYYEIGSNQILGGNFRLPTVNQGDDENDYAIKKVLYRATHTYTGNPTPQWRNVQVNDYIFKIVYRTKDSLRVDQYRPDLRKYLLNGGTDVVPRHSQFYNQQDVLVDSGAFGNNVYGRLLRTGNEIYTIKEWGTDFASLKRAGELYRIYGNLYYVAKVTHTHYPDHYESEVEYSKDFNRLSEIIGIPSEPRFNPISERSLINREIAPTVFLYLTTREEIAASAPHTISHVGFTNMRDILFGGVNADGTKKGVYPRYARVHFFNDELVGAAARPLDKWAFLPLSCYASRNSFVCEWDTYDNLSAGDQVLTSPYSPTPVDSAYRILSPFQYCDSAGRVDLVECQIWTDLPLENDQQIAQLPSGDIFGNRTPTLKAQNSWNDQIKYIVLKDNRERLSMNMTYSVITDSDRFVTSSWLWEHEKGNTYLTFGVRELSKIINNVVPNDIFLRDNSGNFILIPLNVTVDRISTVFPSHIHIHIKDMIEGYLAQAFPPAVGSTDMYDTEKAAMFMANVQSIILGGAQPVVSEQAIQTASYFIMGRNVSDLSFDAKLVDWWLDENLPKFKSQPEIQL